MTERVLVVGAGLGGLACAHRLRQAGRAVTVLEASSRAGGVVGTIAEGGFLFETGPNTVPAAAVHFAALVDELGLRDEFVLSNDAARTRLLFHRGRPRALPSSPASLLTTPLLSWTGKLRLFAEPLRKRAPHPAGEPEPTLAEFLSERIGKEPTQRLAGAFVRGVYGGEVDRLGARSAFPAMWQMVAEHGSLVRGFLARIRARKRARSQSSSQSQAMSTAPTADQPPPRPATPRGALGSFDGGMQRFVDALAAAIGEDLRLNAPVAELARDAEGWAARTAAGEEHRGSHVVLALPAPAAATLLSASERAARELAAVEYASMTVVHIGFPSEAEIPMAFGCLVPPDEQGPGVPSLLGVLFPARIFSGRAPNDGQVASCFYRTADLRGADALVRAREDLARMGIGREVEPAATRVLEWPAAIPQYVAGHDERLAMIEDELARTHPGLFLAASYVGGVSVDGVLGRGQSVADKILTKPPPGPGTATP